MSSASISTVYIRLSPSTSYIGSSNILTEFSHEIKSRNFVFSLGVDFMKKFFSLKEKTFKIFRNTVITKLNKNRFAKNIFFDLANKGFKF